MLTISILPTIGIFMLTPVIVLFSDTPGGCLPEMRERKQTCAECRTGHIPFHLHEL